MKIIITTDNHLGFSRLGDKRNYEMLEKIALEEPSIFINLGDEGSHDPDHVAKFWDKVREYPNLSKIPCYSTSSNHSKWCDPQKSDMTTVEEIVDYVDKIWDSFGVKHLEGTVDQLNSDIYLGGFYSWYQDTQVSTNDWRMTPGLSGAKRMEQWEYLQKRSLRGFTETVNEFNKIKEKNTKAITILYTHMGFLASQVGGDWKGVGNTEYFGAPTSYEYNLDSTSYLFTGHSHREYSCLAKNGITKCSSPGSDYENPKYTILEI